MNKQSHIHKKADSSASNPVISQLQSRPFIAQAKPQPQKPLTQTQTDNQEFQQQKFEATKLELQAKYGTITPEGQEQLTALQAKMSGSLQRKLEQASSKGSNFANIPISRPDAPLQEARPNTLTPVQEKLTIGQPGDKFELEADEMARKVMSMPAVAQPEMGNPEQTHLQVPSKPLTAEITPFVQHKVMPQSDRRLQGAGEFESRLKRSKGGGSPLPRSVQAFMGPRYGADVSDVRVHTGSEAVQMNQAIGALAFTNGKHIYYGPGQSPKNDDLTAHELAHTFQQSGSAVVQNTSTVIGKSALGEDVQLQKATLNTNSLVVQRVDTDEEVEMDFGGFLNEGMDFDLETGEMNIDHFMTGATDSDFSSDETDTDSAIEQMDIDSPTLETEREKKKDEVKEYLNGFLKEKKTDDTTIKGKTKTDKKEYIENLLNLLDHDSKEFEYDLLDPKNFKYPESRLKMQEKILEKESTKEEKKNMGKQVKPYNYEGTKEDLMPMILEKLAKETGESVNLFLETCVGSGQFLSNAENYERFVVADLDSHITNFFQAMKDDPHNLEIDGRIIKAHLKKRDNENTEDWNKKFKDLWDQTLGQVNEKSEAYKAATSLQKALAFIFYKNAGDPTKKKAHEEEYNVPIKDNMSEKQAHRRAYRTKDMKILQKRLDTLPETEIITDEMMNTLKKKHSSADLIFIDPPYVHFTFNSIEAENLDPNQTSTGKYQKKQAPENKEQVPKDELTVKKHKENIKELGEIVRKKAEEQPETKPLTIGYTNQATLDIVEECIKSGAVKIYLYPVVRQLGSHLEILAIFKSHHKQETEAGEKKEVRKNVFNSMREGVEKESKPDKKVEEYREWTDKKLEELKNELVGLVKYELITKAQREEVNFFIKEVTERRQKLLFFLDSMKEGKITEKQMLETLQNWRNDTEEKFLKLEQSLKDVGEKLKKKVEERNKQKKALKKDVKPKNYISFNTLQ